MPAKDKRKLAAIMFADVVGYSRMMASNEERTLELLKDFENICSPIISKHDGEIIKKVGDELFCEFSSAKQAVDSALEIQEAIQPYNDSRPKDFKLQVRIGIHVGDIVLRDGDVFGDGVNVASRIQPFANPGGICVSNAVRDALSSHPSYDIQSEGKQELKNIIEKHTLYSIKTGFEDKTIIKKYKKTQKTVPVLLGVAAVCIAVMLFFGDSMDIWNIENSVKEEKPIKYLIYITSLHDQIEMYEEQRILDGLIQGRKLDTLNYSLIDSISKNIMTLLLSEYYNSKKEFIIPTSFTDQEFLNKYSLTIGDFGTSVSDADPIYNRFDKPNKIFYINLYQFMQDDLDNNQDKYFYSFFNLHCLPSTECITDNIGVADVDIVKELFLDLRKIINKTKRIGTVYHAKEDIVSVKLNDMNIRADMILDATTLYDFSLDGYEKIKSDLNSAIKHYEALNDTFILGGLYQKLNWFADSSKNPFSRKTLSTYPFFYKVRVIEVIDSTAITKIYSKEKFVKIRKGDVISIR